MEGRCEWHPILAPYSGTLFWHGLPAGRGTLV